MQKVREFINCALKLLQIKIIVTLAHQLIGPYHHYRHPRNNCALSCRTDSQYPSHMSTCDKPKLNLCLPG